MWRDDTFSRRNKQQKKGGWGEQDLRKGVRQYRG